MNSCMRCGVKLQHNYLVPVFTTINEKRKRMIVCLKCKEILSKKESETARVAKPQVPETNTQSVPLSKSPRPESAQEATR